MAQKKPSAPAPAAKPKKSPAAAPVIVPHRISLGAALSEAPIYQKAKIWIVGDTPLITHAWSEKARREMLSKQVKSTSTGRAIRDPVEDFENSLYEMAPGVYGFPVTGIKNAITGSAHKDKGVAKTTVRASLFLDANMVRVRPALAGAICDMPLVRIWSGPPEMREDMVRVGVGLSKTATLAYRGQFTRWAIRISARFNPTVLTAEALAFLIQESGVCGGIGEWRNEKNGMFGAFHLASTEEEVVWNLFAAGAGPLPPAPNYTETEEGDDK